MNQHELEPFKPEDITPERLVTAVRVIKGLINKETDPEPYGYVLGDLLNKLEEEKIHGRQQGKKSFWNPFSQERKMREKREFEATHTLGLEPSIASGSHWQIFHPPIDSKISYRELLEPGSSSIYSERFIRFPLDTPRRSGGKSVTEICLNLYTDSTGAERIMLEIYSGYYEEDLLDELIIGNESSEDVNRKIVVFRNTETGEKHFVRIKMASNKRAFEVNEMDEVLRTL